MGFYHSLAIKEEKILFLCGNNIKKSCLQNTPQFKKKKNDKGNMPTIDVTYCPEVWTKGKIKKKKKVRERK